MKTAESKSRPESISLVPKNIPEEITESDEQNFFKMVSVDLDQQQKKQVLTPALTCPRQEKVLAVHWHPEFVPMDLITRRIETMFPNKKQALIIPTQHNQILSYGDYSGVEVDCYSGGFNQKVQLLLHFENANVENAHMLREMLAHTFKYRSSQLFDFIHTLTKPVEDRLELAAKQTGASEDLVRFVRTYVIKIEKLLDKHIATVPVQSIKNKVLRNFFDIQRAEYGDTLIDRAQTFLTAVKQIVKSHFSLRYFYRTSEIIEEARHLNAGVVIPHPEQFWPILLADYDVDGVEVWNPQSHRYTEFLISVIKEKNRKAGPSERPLMIFMGDDTHMGEKTRHPSQQNGEKAGREIGLQPAWDDLCIRKTLIRANFSRERVIEEYKSRLAG
ncbi:hypothetical protein DENIS_0568 [Desulfonema ishimotonii]|uniref:Uncharacterized protein n=1 Tax=Desulfonema ishimotonii TaxID=45657 RepID=A0A401FRN4_9BACT|nr:hypothetical protein [Desulfonema ishimotonii]GBC59629.1 hypothetical protein DENIS_0568 [Desulfonema ishimotonii]